MEQASFDARVTLLQQVHDPQPRDSENPEMAQVIQCNALESLAAVNVEGAGMELAQALRDPHLPVKFAAAMGLGDLGYEPALPVLLEMAKDPQVNPKLLAAVIYALHRLGDDTYTGELGRLLYQEDKSIRATAILVMGKMGESGAIPLLRNVQEEDKRDVVQLQVVEALAELGDERSIIQLEPWTKSQYIEDRLIAIEALGKVNNPRVLALLQKIYEDSRQDPIVRVATIRAMANLYRCVGFEPALQAAQNPGGVLLQARGAKAKLPPADVRTLQVLSVLALGKLNNVQAVPTLQGLLKSPDGVVRVSAARSILTLLPAYGNVAAPARGGEVQPPPPSRSAAAPVKAALPEPRPATDVAVAPGPAGIPAAATTTVPAAPAKAPEAQPPSGLITLPDVPGAASAPATAPQELPSQMSPAYQPPKAGMRTSGAKD
jgi:HEAT repeat protein